MRWLWGSAGVLTLGLGLAFLLVPALPTTPFLVLAAAFFMRASQRLENWLVHHRWFGGPIRDWRAGRGIRRRIRVMFLVLAAAGLGLTLWFLPSGQLVLRWAATGMAVLTAVFLLLLPSPRK